MLFADGDACGDGGHQDNDMLTLDHWLILSRKIIWLLSCIPV